MTRKRLNDHQHQSKHDIPPGHDENLDTMGVDEVRVSDALRQASRYGWSENDSSPKDVWSAAPKRETSANVATNTERKSLATTSGPRLLKKRVVASSGPGEDAMIPSSEFPSVEASGKDRLFSSTTKKVARRGKSSSMAFSSMAMTETGERSMLAATQGAPSRDAREDPSKWQIVGTSRCPQCGSTDLDFSATGGQTSCIVCGHVLEENAVVNDVQFAEGPAGRAAVVGQYIPAGGSVPASLNVVSGMMGMMRHTYVHRESREVTYAAGRRRLAALASQLHLPVRFVDAAHRIFTLAVQQNFVQGRRTQNVAAAALYIICRREKTPHLLIDFSDTLHMNVYVLGNTYLKLCRVLHLALPVIDPSFYIHRFASRLELGSKQNAVSQTALRLISHMKRDWLCTGRRPAGLCGAALLIAARMHGFRRSQREVGAVVRIGDMTIRQRLLELEDTPTGLMKGHELESGTGTDSCTMESDNDVASSDVVSEADGADDGCDPPAFRRRHLRSNEWQEQEQILLGRESADSSHHVVSNLTPQDRAMLESTWAYDTQLEETTMTPDGASQPWPLQHQQRALQSHHQQTDHRDEPKPTRVAFLSHDGDSTTMTRKTVIIDKVPPDSNKLDTDRIEDLSDLDSEEEHTFVCSAEETAAREKIWTMMNHEWLEREAEIARWEKEEPVKFQRLMRKRAYMRGVYKAPAASDRGTQPAARTVREALRFVVTRSKKTSKTINYEALHKFDDPEGDEMGREPSDDDSDKGPTMTSLIAASEQPPTDESSLFDFGDEARPQRSRSRRRTISRTRETTSRRARGR